MPSISITNNFETVPVAIPILNCGSYRHQSLICSGSRVASLNPCGVAGSFSRGRRGKTAQPFSASFRAARVGACVQFFSGASVRTDVPCKVVDFGSPERRHSAGAFLICHELVTEHDAKRDRCGRAAMRPAIHAMISERDHALRPLGASGSPILKLRGNFYPGALDANKSRREVALRHDIRARVQARDPSHVTLNAFGDTKNGHMTSIRRRPKSVFFDIWVFECARTIAQAEFDLAQVGRVKVAVMSRITLFGRSGTAAASQSPGQRTRGEAERVGTSSMPTTQPDGTADAIQVALSELIRLDRYERRAAARCARAHPFGALRGKQTSWSSGPMQKVQNEPNFISKLQWVTHLTFLRDRESSC